MKAFCYETAHPLEAFDLKVRTLNDPVPGDMDLLIDVKAFSLNPVDYKIRRSRNGTSDDPVILGWDAAGIVLKTGKNVSGFKEGDAVFYAGDLMRPGSYASRQAVDARLVAKKPERLSFEEAAALPLTALTAWEALFERGITYTPQTIVLIVGGAGGVGSIAIQLLKAITPATVIVTASRPETKNWVKKMGADHVMGRDLETELARLGQPEVDVIFATTHTKDYVSLYPKILRPFGNLCVIDDPETLDVVPFKAKAQSVHWEFMFAKSMHQFRLESQGHILQKIAHLVQEKRIFSTLTRSLESTLDQLKKGHNFLENGSSCGKTVIIW
ncbi:MAG: zinc-binding alcohol dehydrogenase family protein [Alphaproteobacteria bacterium]|nr:zinc-binding alcohol dehydrogenase family protein [Alphaproteobacteria bacterium]